MGQQFAFLVSREVPRHGTTHQVSLGHQANNDHDLLVLLAQAITKEMKLNFIKSKTCFHGSSQNYARNILNFSFNSGYSIHVT
jgi:hypothetical protein